MNMQTTIETPTIATRAMLASLNIRQWSARRLDRKATDRVISDHNATDKAGRFNKCLIDPVALKPIQKVVNRIRQQHADYTLPWMNDGTRILSSAAFFKYSEMMRTGREEFEREVATFLAEYPELVGQAAAHLGDMFHRDEYPSAGALARRFGFDVEILPFPDASDFRVELGDCEVDRIKRQISESLQTATQEAMQDAWNRLSGVVQRMIDTLPEFKPATSSGKAQGVFRDSLVNNVAALVEILPLLNITGDANLAAMVQRTRNELCAYDADELRESEVARREVTQSAEAIMADMGAFMGAGS